jgi:hypothetical protein
MPTLVPHREWAPKQLRFCLVTKPDTACFSRAAYSCGGAESGASFKARFDSGFPDGIAMQGALLAASSALLESFCLAQFAFRRSCIGLRLGILVVSTSTSMHIQGLPNALTMPASFFPADSPTGA